MTSHIADVLIPLALDTAYSYAVPDGLALKEGDVVQVPLGTREVVGRGLGAARRAAGGNFKPVTGVIEAPGLSAEDAQVPRLGRLVHAGARRARRSRMGLQTRRSRSRRRPSASASGSPGRRRSA